MTCLVLAFGLLALAFAPLAFGAEKPAVGLVFSAIGLVGLALVVVSFGAIGTSRELYRETGYYWIPAKGGALRTRSAALAWLFVIVFGGLGLWLMGLAVLGIIKWSRGGF